MNTKSAIVLLMVGLFAASNALAAGSPQKAPSVSADVVDYNKGVDLMLDKNFAEAEKQFRKALERNERLAEAHNNLAYTLRKQGPEHYEEALNHYNRAIQLKPELPEPYMYRGVLYIQMGNKDMALKDHEKLVSMRSSLAEELEYVVVNGREKEPERFFGVSKTLR
jgi:tetratricopeptide (TPR) repeat protein